MTRRKKIALFCASGLGLLYGYEIVSAIARSDDVSWLHGLGLVLAIAMLVIELRVSDHE